MTTTIPGAGNPIATITTISSDFVSGTVDLSNPVSTAYAAVYNGYLGSVDSCKQAPIIALGVCLGIVTVLLALAMIALYVLYQRWKSLDEFHKRTVGVAFPDLVQGQVESRSRPAKEGMHQVIQIEEKRPPPTYTSLQSQ